MRRKRTERELAERLLSGRAPETVPENLASVVRSLDQLRATPPVDPARAAATVAAMSAIVSGEAPAREVARVRRSPLIATGPRIAAIALACAMIGSSGLALTGSLPSPAQDAAHNVLSKIGVNVPRAHRAHPQKKSSEVSGATHTSAPGGGRTPEVSGSGKSRSGEDRGNHGSQGSIGVDKSIGGGRNGDGEGDHTSSPTASAHGDDRDGHSPSPEPSADPSHSPGSDDSGGKHGKD